MRSLALGLILASLLLLSVAPSAQADLPCKTGSPGERIDCLYEEGTGSVGELVGKATYTIDEIYYSLEYCIREPLDPICWT